MFAVVFFFSPPSQFFPEKVLSLAVANFGASLWYLLNVSVFNVPCGSFFAFLGFYFEPASVIMITCISMATWFFARKSAEMQTRGQIRKTLLWWWAISNILTWLLPIFLGLYFYFRGEYGSDSVFW